MRLFNNISIENHNQENFENTHSQNIMSDQFLTFSTFRDILLIIAGFSAILLYIYQERKKVSEAASLVTSQIEELYSNLKEINSYVLDSCIDAKAFYSSQPILRTNYWDKYKHFFIKEIDAFSFNTIENFYKCASQALEQQEFLKGLQKSGFLTLQQALAGMESNILLQLINSPIPQNQEPNIKACLNTTESISKIANEYQNKKEILLNCFNKEKIDTYVPQQINDTLKIILQDFQSSPVLSCSGFTTIRKIARRKF